MSYRCDNCNGVHKGKELKRVAEAREVTYNKNFIKFNRRDNKKITQFDEAFTGTEYVREDKLCSGCFENTSDIPPVITEHKIVNFVGTKKKKVEDRHGDDNQRPDFKGLKDKFEKGR
jgi:hypothetical protein